MQRVVMFSGGIGSWAAARRVADAHGTDGLTLLFADTRTEDEDLYRFVTEAAADVGGELVRIVEGRDIWQVFHDERMMGSTRLDPCSKMLKRKPMRRWLDDNLSPDDTTVYLGIDWSEQHRYDRALHHWSPWNVLAPLCDAPYLNRDDHIATLRARGIEPPRLYSWGMPHNNCGGFCVKAGISQFVRLLEVAPERYAYHEAKEQEFREMIGKDVSILRDRTGDGKTKPLTMAALRKRQQKGDTLPLFDWGGCACLEPAEGEPDGVE
jgi:hypothetical protein